MHNPSFVYEKLKPLPVALVRVDVAGSLEDSMDRVESEALVEEDRDPRVAFTVWTTTSSTYTVTSTSTNTSTTFSLSYFCTISGASFPTSCS